MRIVGKEDVDYVSKKTNKPVKGISLHCVGTSNKVEGQCVEAIYVSSRSPMYDAVMEYPLNAEILVGYNRYGSVESINLKK